MKFIRVNQSSVGGGQSETEPQLEGLPAPTSTRVAYRLAEECNTDVTELRPLAESVDPEALDAIFDGRPAEGASVTFRHEGFIITVTGGAKVLVDPVGPE